MSFAEVERLNAEADRLGEIYNACVREKGHDGCQSEAQAYVAAVQKAREENYAATMKTIIPATPSLELPGTLQEYEAKLREGFPGLTEIGEAIRTYENLPVQSGLTEYLKTQFPGGIPEPYKPTTSTPTSTPKPPTVEPPTSTACLIAAILIPLGLCHILPVIRLFRDNHVPKLLQGLYYGFSKFVLPLPMIR